MKPLFIKIFWPILKNFENSEGDFKYKSSHRVILLVVGFLFFCLSTISAIAAAFTSQPAAILPVLIFFSVAVVTVVVGALGTDRAVARIWSSK